MSENPSVGVIVARFQTPILHSGHEELLEYVLRQNHNLNIIVLGQSLLGVPTKKNPLDVDSRMRMIQEMYPGKFVVTWIKDIPDDDRAWSDKLDETIEILAGKRDVILYGSRDSFAAGYYGRYPCDHYEQQRFASATKIREIAGKTVHGSAAFRHGVCWATQNQYPKVYPTVDVAIMNGDRLIVGMRKNSKYLRFIGGFVDPTDESFEDAAKREVKEETNGILVNPLIYLGSYKVDDPRYRQEEDKIITTFYMGIVMHYPDRACGSDDMESLVEMRVNKLRPDQFVPEHRKLLERLQTSDNLRYYLKDL